MQIQVKQSYKGKNISSLYRVPFVYSKRPNIGPADYWSLTLHPVEYSDGYIHSEYLASCRVLGRVHSESLGVVHYTFEAVRAH